MKILLFTSYAYFFISSTIETDRQTNTHTYARTSTSMHTYLCDDDVDVVVDDAQTDISLARSLANDMNIFCDNFHAHFQF